MLHLRLGKPFPSVLVPGDKYEVNVKITNDTGRCISKRDLAKPRRFKVKVKILNDQLQSSKNCIALVPKDMYIDGEGRTVFNINIQPAKSETKPFYFFFEAKDTFHKMDLTKGKHLNSAIGSENSIRVSTLYLGPIRVEAKALSLHRCNTFRIFDYKEVEASLKIQEDTECVMAGYGTIVWTGSVVTSRYLLNHRNEIHGKNVLELGAGCGLCSIVSSICGAKQVVATDVSPALDLLKKNLETNLNANKSMKAKTKVHKFDWNSSQDLEKLCYCFPQGFDYVICTEVFYSFAILETLSKVLLAICKLSPMSRDSTLKSTNAQPPKTKVLLCQSDRATLISVDKLLEYLIQTSGFSLHQRVVTEKDYMNNSKSLDDFELLMQPDCLSKGIGRPQLFILQR